MEEFQLLFLLSQDHQRNISPVKLPPRLLSLMDFVEEEIYFISVWYFSNSMWWHPTEIISTDSDLQHLDQLTSQFTIHSWLDGSQSCPHRLIMQIFRVCQVWLSLFWSSFCQIFTRKLQLMWELSPPPHSLTGAKHNSLYSCLIFKMYFLSLSLAINEI